MKKLLKNYLFALLIILIPTLQKALVDIKNSATVASYNCVVPFEGVTIACDTPVTPDAITTTSLRCFNKDSHPYCIKCVEVIPGKPKQCQLLDIKGQPLK